MIINVYTRRNYSQLRNLISWLSWRCTWSLCSVVRDISDWLSHPLCIHFGDVSDSFSKGQFLDLLRKDLLGLIALAHIGAKFATNLYHVTSLFPCIIHIMICLIWKLTLKWENKSWSCLWGKGNTLSPFYLLIDFISIYWKESFYLFDIF